MFKVVELNLVGSLFFLVRSFICIKKIYVMNII